MAAQILARAPAPLTPLEPQTFAVEADRARLSSVALKAFLALAKAWTLSNAEASSLLGVSESTLDRIKRRDAADAESGRTHADFGSRGHLQGTALAVCRPHGGRLGASRKQGASVRSQNAGCGDDRGRDSPNAGRASIYRRGSGRTLIAECSMA